MFTRENHPCALEELDRAVGTCQTIPGFPTCSYGVLGAAGYVAFSGEPDMGLISTHGHRYCMSYQQDTCKAYGMSADSISCDEVAAVEPFCHAFLNGMYASYVTAVD